MYIWISYATFDISTFEVVTNWSRDYETIPFMWIFELTYDICITSVPIMIYKYMYKDLQSRFEFGGGNGCTCN